jgi:hypothetical protein
VTERANIPPDVQAAIERVLDATGRRALGNDFDTSELAELLDPASVKRSLIAVFSEQRRPAFAKERRKHFDKAAKLARELHELLTAEPFQKFDIWTHLKGMEKGSGFPIGEWEADPWAKAEKGSYPIDDPPKDKTPPRIGSYPATVNGIARLGDALSAFVDTHGDEPFVDPDGFSENEELITGAVTNAWNTLKGRKRHTPGSHSHTTIIATDDDADWIVSTHKTDGPFVRFAVAVMKELGQEVAPGTVAKAVTKAKARDRRD